MTTITLTDTDNTWTGNALYADDVIRAWNPIEDIPEESREETAALIEDAVLVSRCARPEDVSEDVADALSALGISYDFLGSYNWLSDEPWLVEEAEPYMLADWGGGSGIYEKAERIDSSHVDMMVGRRGRCCDYPLYDAINDGRSADGVHDVACRCCGNLGRMGGIEWFTSAERDQANREMIEDQYSEENGFDAEELAAALKAAGLEA